MKTLEELCEALGQTVAALDMIREERDGLRKELDEKMAQVAGLERLLGKVCGGFLTKETVDECITMTLDYQDLLCDRVAEEAGNIVKYAKDPGDPDFSYAVAAHRDAQKELRRAEDLENRLRAAVQ